MSLLDSVLGMAMGAMNNNQAAGQQPAAMNPQAMLMQAALGMLSNGSAAGGLSGVLGMFAKAGLGQAAQSWVGTGANSPINGNQIQQVLGGLHLEELAKSAGLPLGDTANHLAEMLPGLIDKLTPHGQAPQAGLGDAMGLLQQLMTKRA